jgi:hypothetical protein
VANFEPPVPITFGDAGSERMPMGAALSRRARREQFRSLDEPEHGVLRGERVRDLAVGVA